MARERRARGVQETLGAIVLVTEIIVVFLAALVINGLGALPPALALGGGGALILLMIVAAGTLRWPIGVVLGWLVQATVVAGGLLVPDLFLVGGLFVAIWAYCMIMGGRIDRRNAAG
ncbi:DUF4233 domain-containing protein [Naasia aerilata]|uniref:DUF4233 domain-containing protein n=1 Tax=Naasia aerilata TaxID=1162966 RepID=A0ABM8GEP4_9MICO|nr:DUF4233 domain-containing protein [Naasia aerilata]BDZ46563.1 hypothetical protein GCM10025866_24720 [Naasia aerilata]